MKTSFVTANPPSYFLSLVQVLLIFSKTNADYLVWGKFKRTRLFPFAPPRSTTTSIRGGGQTNPCAAMQAEKHDATSLDEHSCRPLDSSVDFSDNEIQKQILLKHYRNEGCDDKTADGSSIHISPGKEALQAFLRDYTGDSVVHRVINGDAATHYGIEGGRRLWETMCGTNHQLKIRHLSVQNNHARVVWEDEVDAERASLNAAKTVLVGTDWITFDLHNHIRTQTTVALSEQK